MATLIKRLRKHLRENENKIHIDFIKLEVEHGIVKYYQPTKSMRTCVIVLDSGHEVIGEAQVLDLENDVEKFGNKAAYNKAFEKLWGNLGSIAKAILEEDSNE